MGPGEQTDHLKLFKLLGDRRNLGLNVVDLRLVVLVAS